MIEPEPDGKFHRNHVDAEDQHEPVPQALDGEDIFHSAPHEPNEDVEVANMEEIETPVPDRDAEQMQAGEAVDVAFTDADDTGYESDVAE